MEDTSSPKRCGASVGQQEQQGALVDLPAKWNVTHSVLLVIRYSVPHGVVPQLLHPVLAAHIDESEFILATAAERALFATELSLRNMCPEAESEALWALELPALEAIVLPMMSQSINAVITKLADHAPQHLPRLRAISMRQCRAISAQAPAALCRMPTVTSLDFSDTQDSITADALAVLKKGMPQLRELVLTCCRQIDARALSHVGGMAQLQSLELDGAYSIPHRPGRPPQGQFMDAAALKELAPLRHLQLLGVGRNPAINADTFGVIAQHLTRLKRINVASCSTTAAELAELEPLAQLEVLDLSASPRVDDAALFQISTNHRRLRTLLLSECKGFTAAGVAQLRQLLCLRELDLSDCSQVGVDVLWHASHFTSLERLNVAGCDVDEVGVSHIGQLPKLSVLTLHYCLVETSLFAHAQAVLSAVPHVQWCKHSLARGWVPMKTQ